MVPVVVVSVPSSLATDSVASVLADSAVSVDEDELLLLVVSLSTTVIDTDVSSSDNKPVAVPEVISLTNSDAILDRLRLSVESLVIANVTSTLPGDTDNMVMRDDETPNNVANSLVNSVTNALLASSSADMVS